MIQFTKPTQLNGFQLRDELRAAGVQIEDGKDTILTDGEKLLWLAISKTDESAAKQVVANHIGIDKEPTIEDKLASVGLSLPDLKTALGL
ncbi:MAG: hypothetical protein EB057_05060 [Microbacteriaceae bacterium]|nr:hypothetical protein [Microbacteriaceae bacterium]